MQDDPFLHPVLTVHISVMKRLKLTSELFYCAHKLVDTSPDSAVTWFAAGTYYLLVENFEHARQYFKYVFFFVCVTRLLLCCNACVPYVVPLVCLYRGSLSAHTTSSSRTSSTAASILSTFFCVYASRVCFYVVTLVYLMSLHSCVFTAARCRHILPPRRGLPAHLPVFQVPFFCVCASRVCFYVVTLVCLMRFHQVLFVFTSARRRYLLPPRRTSTLSSFQARVPF